MKSKQEISYRNYEKTDFQRPIELRLCHVGLTNKCLLVFSILYLQFKTLNQRLKLNIILGKIQKKINCFFLYTKTTTSSVFSKMVVVSTFKSRMFFWLKLNFEPKFILI